MAVLNASEFLQVFAAIVFGWVLISLWVAALNCYMYDYLGFNPRNSRHVFAIALLFTAIFLFYVFTAPTDTSLSAQVVDRMSSITTFDAGTGLF